MIATLLAVELIIGGAGLVTFCALYARLPWRDTATGRQLMLVCAYWAVIILMRAVDLTLIHIPAWMFALGWAPLAPITWWWVVLLARGRRAHPTVTSPTRPIEKDTP